MLTQHSMQDFGHTFKKLTYALVNVPVCVHVCMCLCVYVFV